MRILFVLFCVASIGILAEGTSATSIPSEPPRFEFEQILSHLQDGNRKTREDAVREISLMAFHLGNPNHPDNQKPLLSDLDVKALLNLLEHSDSGVRSSAASALSYLRGNLSDHQAVLARDKLLPLEDAPDREVRNAAGNALSGLSNRVPAGEVEREAVRYLKRLSRPEFDVRNYAVRTLGALANRLDEKTLVAALAALLAARDAEKDPVMLDAISNGIRAMERADTERKGLTGVLERLEIKGRGTRWRIGKIHVARPDGKALAGLAAKDQLLEGKKVKALGTYVSTACFACEAHTTEIAHVLDVLVLSELSEVP